MFIPRHPVVENQFCKYASTATGGGAGDVIAYAGSVVYLDVDATNEESMVMSIDDTIANGQTPFGFLMQKVKTGYHSVHPVGMVLPGDLGSSDAIAQPTYNADGSISGTDEVPVGVAHLGIWDTVHYTCLQATTDGTVDADDQMKPGQPLYTADTDAKVTNAAAGAGTGQAVDDSMAVARVVKGASAAKCSANISNSTLYPIRVKLLV